MASTRKKQDEKNLKVLRELVSLPHNKYCFDCNQRGPTYVNVTIGSFVCTKCSGMLRGITPPHRVKSISMATFNLDEIEFVRSRGNNFCRKTFLGLHEGPTNTEMRDEQQIRDFMVDKYERKRYYIEPTVAMLNNGHVQEQNIINSQKVAESKPLSNLISDVKPLRINGSHTVNQTKTQQQSKNNSVEFVADFASADIFNATNNNNPVHQSFANFDNNPIFNNTQNGTQLQNSSTQNFFNSQPQQQMQPSKNSNVKAAGPPAPSEDRYAALKDLDNALKAQPTLDWNSGSTNSLYSSSTNPGSVYSSPSPQGSMYGSPSQSSQFSTIFPQEPAAPVSNPFNSSNLWNSNGNVQTQANGMSTANPFRAQDPFKTDLFKTDPFATDGFKGDPFKMNGFNSSFQTIAYTQPINGTAWTPNPFKLGASSNGHSNNPFL